MPSLIRKEEELVDSYARIISPSPALHEILSNREHARLLHHAMRRQVKSISDRSSIYDDGEVTVFDKALVELYKQGDQLKNIGLLELFLTEFLVTGTSATLKQEEAVVHALLAAQKAIDKILDHDKLVSNRDANNGHLSTVAERDRDDHDGVKIKVEMETQAKNEKALEKLIGVYQAALADYYLKDASKSGLSDKQSDKFTNVRFLRDTAENLLRYMKSEDFLNHPLLPQVEKVVHLSQDHAERLAGRKRIFELPEDEDTRPRAPRYKRTRYSRHRGDSWRPAYNG
ncbi:hypothetical protein N7462_004895 [Penicillium macrosclerotiorum]|uniref:uncharacterized protein n=1 Tax=Penicillium macrosclerotiorum TaxID=303699 RepID=UPI0025490387|nr:uncharacterized protein N7462_004895 [Penicillium macrosclerotiorum]KAJ5690503.1 hypothetical protein N7462_004895 [Penicillium macrosclerotiorum]